MGNNSASLLSQFAKYSISGEFSFSTDDSISSVCNAPRGQLQFGGIYLIYAVKSEGDPELIYVGISGRVDKKTGKLVSRKDGINGRIVNGKRDGELRKNFWKREMHKENILRLVFKWYVVHDNGLFQDCPEKLEKQLIVKYQPRWNRT